MTVSSQTSSEKFDGNGVTTIWDLPFRFFNDTDLVVYKIEIATQVMTPFVLGSDYTLSGAGLPEQFGTAPGKITTTLPIATGYQLFVQRIMEVEQLTDIVNQGRFFPEVHEDVFDRLTMLVQQVDEEVDRCIKVGLADTPLDPLPNSATRSNTVIGFDALGNLVTIPIPSSVGAGDRIPFTLVDGVNFVAGTSTQVILPAAPGATGNLELFFDPLFQGFDQWSVAGAVVTFTSAIPLGVTKIFGYIGTTLSMQIPPDGSVSEQKLATGAVSTRALADGSVTDIKVKTGSRLSARIMDTVSIRDFSSFDPADIAPSLLEAYNYLNDGSSSYGGKVIIPRGSFHMNPVDLPAFFFSEARVTIQGSGWGTIIRPVVGLGSGNVLITARGGMTELLDFAMDNPTGIASTTGILFEAASQVIDAPEIESKVERIRFTSLGQGFQNNNQSAWRLRDCSFLSCDLGINSANGGMRAWVEGNNFQGGTGMRFDQAGWNSEGRHISNNNMVAMYSGIQINDGVAYDMIGNQIDANDSECIFITGTPSHPTNNVSISGGWLSGGGTHGIKATGNVGRLAISDCSIVGHSQAGINLDGNGVARVSVMGTKCNGNSVDLRVNQAVIVTVHGNDFGSTNGIQEVDNVSSCVVVGNNVSNVINKSTKSVYHYNFGDDISY